MSGVQCIYSACIDVGRLETSSFKDPPSVPIRIRGPNFGRNHSKDYIRTFQMVLSSNQQLLAAYAPCRLREWSLSGSSLANID